MVIQLMNNVDDIPLFYTSCPKYNIKFLHEITLTHTP